MLQLKVSFSPSEAEVLMRCISQLETQKKDAVVKNSSASKKNMHALQSAKKKVTDNVFDDFHHDEIINMVFALDTMSRKCNSQLTEHTPLETAQELSGVLRTAASVRSKLRRAMVAD